jgi:hypothetical protein
MFGCVRHKFETTLKEFEEVLPWSEVEKHIGERGFCNHPCAQSGSLVWLHYYNEGSLTYCPKCGHYGILIKLGVK